MSPQKRMKLEIPATVDQPNQNRVIRADDVAVATASNNHQKTTSLTPPPPYLKLIADCWEHIFDYLSIKDVLVMGQTCKRMEQMAGYYVREYFPELRYDLIDRKVKLTYPYTIQLRPNFYQYISKLCIMENSKLDFHLDAKTFPALKSLVLKWFKFDEARFEHIRNVLKNIDSIYMANCLLTFEIFEQLAIHCPNLKHLRISFCDIPENSLRSLFSQHFPMLEHLKYKTRKWNFNTCFDELKTFLEVHTSLEQLHCSIPVVWTNRDVLRTTNTQLSVLGIDFYTWRDRVPFDRFVDFLNELHSRGACKAFHLSFDYDSNTGLDNIDNALAKLSAIETVCIEDESIINLSRLTNLKELNLYYEYEYKDDVEVVSTSLVKLERLILKGTTIDDVLPFVRNSKRLKSIKIHEVFDGVDVTDDVNVFALNEERKKGSNDDQILMYLPETIYLRAKWKTKNLNLSHVKIARIVQDNC